MKPKPHIIVATFVVFCSLIAMLLALGYGDTEFHPTVSKVYVLILLFTISLLLLLLSHSIASIFAYILNRKLIRQHQDDEIKPKHPVAVLLCTRDDWIPEVGRKCLDALRIEDHLFICDDSESMEFKTIVGDFSKKHKERCTLVRRDNLEGWKAGNLNNCLSMIPGSFKYFIVVDHDNIISRDMLEKADSTISSDPNLGFLQFRSQINHLDSTKFSKNLSSSIEAIWILLSVRMIYGFRFNVGHVVAFNRDAVLKVNGFPEKILTEDIAITIKLLAAGYKTSYCMSMGGSETVPSSYARYRARYCRWCIGTAQTWVSGDALLFLKKSSLHISADGLLLAANLLYSFPVGILLIVLSVASPIVIAPPADGGVALKLLTLLSLICPNIPIVMAQKTLVKAVRFVPIQMAIYFSLIVPVVVSVLGSFIFNRFIFENTGNKKLERQKQSLFSSNGIGTIIIEVVISVFLIINILTIGPFGVLFLSGILAGIAFMIFDWNSNIIDAIKYFPFTVFLASTLVIFTS